MYPSYPIIEDAGQEAIPLQNLRLSHPHESENENLPEPHITNHCPNNILETKDTLHRGDLDRYTQLTIMLPQMSLDYYTNADLK